MTAELLDVIEGLKADLAEARTERTEARREALRLREEVAELRVIRDDAEAFQNTLRKALAARKF